MNPDTLWLVRMGIDQGLFTRAQCVSVKVRLGGHPSMLDFAQKLVDEDIVTNLEALEMLAGQAALQAKKGPPSTDPFLAPDELVEDIVAMPVKKEAPGPAPVLQNAIGASQDEKVVAQTLKDLLASSLKFGASDLHLCTGRRPFVRKDRSISFISEKPLTAD